MDAVGKVPLIAVDQGSIPASVIFFTFFLYLLGAYYILMHINKVLIQSKIFFEHIQMSSNELLYIYHF